MVVASTPSGSPREKDGTVHLKRIWLEARVVEEAVWLVGVEEPDAARGEQALEPASTRRGGTQDAHDGETPAGFEDPARLPQYTGRVAELVEGAAADGARERGVEERKLLRARPDKGRLRPSHASSPGPFSQHGRGDIYSDGDAAVEVAAEAAGVEARGATQVEVAASADGTDEAFDDLQLPLVRERFAGEQAEGVHAPERFVATSGSRQEVRKVGEAVRAGAGLQEIQVSVFDLVGFARRRGAGFAGQDHTRSLRTTRVDKTSGIRGSRTDHSEQLLANHLAPSSVAQAVQAGVEAPDGVDERA